MDAYLVVGTPISHSLSPKLHNAVYQRLDLPRELEAHDPKDEAGFEQLIQELRAGKYSGFCVTIPYKLAAYQACDNLTEVAQRTGAVNYLRREADGSLTGDNTDAGGFVRAVKQELGFDFVQSSVVVCGSGGASRAIVDALIQEEAAHIAVASRNPAHTAQEWNIPDASLAQITKSISCEQIVDSTPHHPEQADTISPLSFQTEDAPFLSSRAERSVVERSCVSEPRASCAALQSVNVSALCYEALERSNSHFDLLVNTTPLGMNDERMPVSKAWLHSAAPDVYDVVYRKEGTTPLVAAARQAGIPAADGRSMLIEQAILGMRFWGIEEDSQALHSIIDASLNELAGD